LTDTSRSKRPRKELAYTNELGLNHSHHQTVHA
jgi:hypothetical protein